MKLEYSETYLYKLHLLTSSLDKLFDDTLTRRANIGFSQFSLLLSVNQHQPVSQRAIARSLGLTPGAVSRQVEIARTNHWVRVVSDKADRRGHLLSIAPGGTHALKRGLRVLEKDVFNIFDDQDRQMGLMAHIDQLLGSIQEVASRAKD